MSLTPYGRNKSIDDEVKNITERVLQKISLNNQKTRPRTERELIRKTIQ